MLRRGCWRTVAHQATRLSRRGGTRSTSAGISAACPLDRRLLPAPRLATSCGTRNETSVLGFLKDGVMYPRSLAAIIGLVGALASCGGEDAGKPGGGGAGAGSSAPSTGVDATEYCNGDDAVSAACAKADPSHPIGCICSPNAGPFGSCSPQCPAGQKQGEFCCAATAPGSGGAGGAGGSGSTTQSTGASTADYCHEDADVAAVCAKKDASHPIGCICSPNAGPFGSCSPQCPAGPMQDEFCCAP
jgi:hypothetical protein